MRLTSFLSTGLVLAAAFAAPSKITRLTTDGPLLSKRDSLLPPNTQTCAITPWGDPGSTVPGYVLVNQYIITVGEPFDGGVGCDSIHDHISSAVGGFGAWEPTWSCTAYPDDGTDEGVNTSLAFCVLPDLEAQVNGALAGAYPGVFGGFNCQTCGQDCEN